MLEHDINFDKAMSSLEDSSDLKSSAQLTLNSGLPWTNPSRYQNRFQ